MILPYSKENIRKAAELLKNGELAAFPTETVYGLGADARSDRAVKKIYQLKGRPSNNPLIVHVAKYDKVLELIDHSQAPLILSRLEKLKHFWPGPLSIIVKKSIQISNLVSAQGDTVAIRIPQHPIALELLNEVDIPIAAPSANKSFAVSPTCAEHVKESFKNQNIFILDGGSCSVGLESTVINITSKLPTLLRPGAITAAQISACLGEECQIIEQKLIDNDKDILASPGLLKLHYSPKTPLIFIDELESFKNHSAINNLGVILFSNKHEAKFKNYTKNISILSLDANLEVVAKNLYAEIRKLDSLNLSLILVDCCEKAGIGDAIMDRLERARHLP